MTGAKSMTSRNSMLYCKPSWSSARNPDDVHERNAVVKNAAAWTSFQGACRRFQDRSQASMVSSRSGGAGCDLVLVEDHVALPVRRLTPGQQRQDIARPRRRMLHSLRCPHVVRAHCEMAVNCIRSTNIHSSFDDGLVMNSRPSEGAVPTASNQSRFRLRSCSICRLRRCAHASRTKV